MCVCVRACVYMYVRTHVCVCTCTYVCACEHVHVCIHVCTLRMHSIRNKKQHLLSTYQVVKNFMSKTRMFTYIEVPAGDDENEHWNWDDKHPNDTEGKHCPHHMREMQAWFSSEAMELKKQIRHEAST